MRSPVILGAVRSPLGSVHGALAGRHPADLLATVLAALSERAGFEPGEVAEVVCGCLEPVGGQGGDVARGAALLARWPDTVGGSTVDRGPTSGLAAFALARALVASGAAPLVVAAAVDMPSVVPPGAAAMGRHPYGRPWGAVSTARELVPPGVAAERLGVERVAQDEWAAASTERAHLAAHEGRFAAEIVAIGGCDADEVLPGRSTDQAALAELPPAFDADGTITSGNAALLADGAVAVAVADPDWAAGRDLNVLAALDAVALTAAPPDDLVTAAHAAARAVLGTGATPADAVEVPESTASLAVALQRAGAFEHAVTNRWGGAIALGELAGASDLRAVVTLVHQLARDDLAGGLVIAGGLGVGAAARLSRR